MPVQESTFERHYSVEELTELLTRDIERHASSPPMRVSQGSNQEAKNSPLMHGTRGRMVKSGPGAVLALSIGRRVRGEVTSLNN